ncbi:MAG: HD domain-containing protein [Peptococcaceae bacterium]|jgi:HD superfamily phosphodiesterase|nr:HD domain-containing protein [Peptococcaceae bacterium]MBQ2014843.1 HD domain-containing protein [Peptococcaceae bacterium]MBQ2035234.1 HD domain-containing protein [Peptococcaceae bacterium]MBQ2449553.1 HD domain-containing protein [Peptococcaceae bacterium]MBQ5652178.1 HD domain-containing protein [Peptococcaceae bacterium]
MKITFEDIYNNKEIQLYIRQADESMRAMGYTEHSFAHVGRVANWAQDILLKLGYSERDAELARIAAYLHDMGNIINRQDHAQNSALMAFQLLKEMQADPEDIAAIITAIGNHDEGTAFPVNPISAAIILADKADVRCSRVRNKDFATFDIHDRVNYSVKKSELHVEKDSYIELQLLIDTEVCAVMDYFEIFMQRMLLCRKAAEKLNLQFRLTINNQRIL